MLYLQNILNGEVKEEEEDLKDGSTLPAEHTYTGAPLTVSVVRRSVEALVDRESVAKQQFASKVYSRGYGIFLASFLGKFFLEVIDSK